MKIKLLITLTVLCGIANAQYAKLYDADDVVARATEKKFTFIVAY